MSSTANLPIAKSADGTFPIVQGGIYHVLFSMPDGAALDDVHTAIEAMGFGDYVWQTVSFNPDTTWEYPWPTDDPGTTSFGGGLYSVRIEGAVTGYQTSILSRPIAAGQSVMVRQIWQVIGPGLTAPTPAPVPGEPPPPPYTPNTPEQPVEPQGSGSLGFVLGALAVGLGVVLLKKRS